MKIFLEPFFRNGPKFYCRGRLCYWQIGGNRNQSGDRIIEKRILLQQRKVSPLGALHSHGQLVACQRRQKLARTSRYAWESHYFMSVFLEIPDSHHDVFANYTRLKLPGENLCNSLSVFYILKLIDKRVLTSLFWSTAENLWHIIRRIVIVEILITRSNWIFG